MHQDHPGRGLFAAARRTTNGQPHSNGHPPNSVHTSQPTQSQSSRLGFDNSMQPVHVRSNGQRVHPDLLYTEDDPFVQDFRARSGEAARPSTGYEDHDIDIDGPRVERQYDHDQQMRDQGRDDAAEEDTSHSGEDHEAHVQAGEEEEDEPDLFDHSFGNMKESPEEEDDDDDSDSDIEITGSGPANPNKLKSFFPNAKKGAQHPSDLDTPAEHTPACNPSRRTSTPPTSPKPTKPTPPTTFPPAGPNQANLEKDLRRTLHQQRKFHTRTLLLAPSTPRPIPSHRYLIAVLHADRKPSPSNTEKHFIWMLGNHITTISTVVQTYQLTTLSAPVVLLHGQERLRDKCLLREVDYFNDKFICLRAVYVRDPRTDAWNPAARCKELTEGLIGPEIIEID